MPSRHPVSIIYRCARAADDFADACGLPAAEPRAPRDVYRQELRRLEAGLAPQQAIFVERDEIVHP